jgi:hypothetical protein
MFLEKKFLNQTKENKNFLPEAEEKIKKIMKV